MADVTMRIFKTQNASFMSLDEYFHSRVMDDYKVEMTLKLEPGKHSIKSSCTIWEKSFNAPGLTVMVKGRIMLTQRICILINNPTHSVYVAFSMCGSDFQS
jgi:hypothetical protein